MSRALVLLSGGTDSCVALLLAKRNCDKVLALGMQYGQVHARELKAAQDVAHAFGVTYSELPLPKYMFTGKLISGEPLPEGRLRDITPHGLSPAEVPFRNAVLLASAVSTAIVTECDQVWHGIHAEDGTDWAYPDNSPEFLGSLAAAIWIGSAQRVRLVSPFIHMTKADVVHLGLQHGAPFQLTYSCYVGDEQPCGKCIACMARKEAFQLNHTEDPAKFNTEELTIGVLKTDGKWYPK